MNRIALNDLKKECVLYEFVLDNVGWVGSKKQLNQNIKLVIKKHEHYWKKMRKYCEHNLDFTLTIRNDIWVQENIFHNSYRPLDESDHYVTILESFYLISKDNLPFWMLKEYGGPVDPRYIIDYTKFHGEY